MLVHNKDIPSSRYTKCGEYFKLTKAEKTRINKGLFTSEEKLRIERAKEYLKENGLYNDLNKLSNIENQKRLLLGHYEGNKIWGGVNVHTKSRNLLKADFSKDSIKLFLDKGILGPDMARTGEILFGSKSMTTMTFPNQIILDNFIKANGLQTTNHKGIYKKILKVGNKRIEKRILLNIKGEKFPNKIGPNELKGFARCGEYEDVGNYFGKISQELEILHGLKAKPNLAGQILRSGAGIDKFQDLNGIAKRMGYDLVKGESREGLRVFNSKGVWITDIPQHSPISTGVSKSVLKALEQNKPVGKFGG